KPCGGAVVAEACGIGDEAAGAQALAVKYAITAVPGMVEVPHLITSHHDGIKGFCGRRIVRCERLRKWKRLNRLQKQARFSRVFIHVTGLFAQWIARLQCATPLFPADAWCIVVEQNCFMSSRANSF